MSVIDTNTRVVRVFTAQPVKPPLGRHSWDQTAEIKVGYRPQHAADDADEVGEETRPIRIPAVTRPASQESVPVPLPTREPGARTVDLWWTAKNPLGLRKLVSNIGRWVRR